MFVFSEKSQELQENLKVFMNDYIYPNEEKITASPERPPKTSIAS